MVLFYHLEAPILCCPNSQQIACTIGRAIIHSDNLKICQSLPFKTFQGSREHSTGIEAGHEYRDFWHHLIVLDANFFAQYGMIWVN
jgi:hypothetical protein